MILALKLLPLVVKPRLELWLFEERGTVPLVSNHCSANQSRSVIRPTRFQFPQYLPQVTQDTQNPEFQNQGFVDSNPLRNPGHPRGSSRQSTSRRPTPGWRTSAPSYSRARAALDEGPLQADHRLDRVEPSDAGLRWAGCMDYWETKPATKVFNYKPPGKNDREAFYKNPEANKYCWKP